MQIQVEYQLRRAFGAQGQFPLFPILGIAPAAEHGAADTMRPCCAVPAPVQ
jgi:hypothetical protein